MGWSALSYLFAADDATAATAPTTNHDTNWAGADSAVISLNPGESCQIFIYATSGATSSDLQFRVLTSLDGTTFDTTPYLSGTIGYVTNAAIHSRTITVYGVKNFKLQFAPSANVAWNMEGGSTMPCCACIKDGISA